jgi:hypothetical protein
MKKNKSEEKGEEQRRQERIAVYLAWAKDEERAEVIRANVEHAIASGLL